MGATPNKEIKPTNEGNLNDLMQLMMSQAANQDVEMDDDAYDAIIAQADEKVKAVFKQILNDSNNDVELALAKCDAALVRLIVLGYKVGIIIGERYQKAPLLTKDELKEFQALKSQLVASGVYTQETVDQYKLLQFAFADSLRPVFEEILAEMKPVKKAVAKPRP